MIVGIHQPNYLPWLGYFRKLAQSDVFVFFDNVQAPGGKSFVYRNRVKTAAGALWLTVPVERSSETVRIADMRIADRRFVRKHLRTLETSYAHAGWREPALARIRTVLDASHERIADLNVALVEAICELCGIETRLVRATTLGLAGEGAATIPEILSRLEATVYLTGDGAGSRRHLDEASLAGMDVECRVVSTAFAPYPQHHGEFEPGLSALDALLECGPEGVRGLIEGAGAPV